MIALSPIVQNKRNYININQDKTYGVKWEFEISPLKNISIGYGHHLLWNRNDFYSSTTTQKLDEYLLSKDFNAKLNYCIPKFHSTLHYSPSFDNNQNVFCNKNKSYRQFRFFLPSITLERQN